MTLPTPTRPRSADREPAPTAPPAVPPARAAVLPPPEPPPVVRRVPLLSTSLLLLGVLLLGFAAHLFGTGAAYHAREQQLGYAELREDLANAVAPVGPSRDGVLLEPGTPVALLEVPSLGLREVVREGTTSGVLAAGPGHRRDTVLPGQGGTSVLFGRRVAFGGPFGDLDALRPGTELRVTTGQGRSVFRVTTVRRAGDPVPPALAAGAGRLTLVTADGPSLAPDGVLRVDADLVGPAQPAPPRALGALPEAEQALAGDGRGVVGLLLLAQLLLAAGCGLAWAAARWGARQAWVVGVPVVVGLGLATAHAASALLPNLL